MEQRNRITLPALGALLAALIGGAIWAAIVVQTNYELGLIAWAIGGLAGYAVVKLNPGQCTGVHQGIAVIASLLGILLGKYFAFGYIFTESFEGIFEGELFSLFINNLGEFFGAMDIVFVILAVLTAWRIPGRTVQPAAHTDGGRFNS